MLPELRLVVSPIAACIIFYMNENWDRTSLRGMLAVFEKLDSGWQPGEAELDCARTVENWTILPSKDRTPFRLIGNSWTLPISHTLIVVSVFALDRSAHWARTLDEWVVIGDPADSSARFDAMEIQRTGANWLWTELQRLPASA